MVESSHSSRPALIAAVVVTHDSSPVLPGCLAALGAAAPRRGLEITVVDNASADGSATLAETAPGVGRVVRLALNRGFAAGVNAGLAGARQPWLAVVNPDVELPGGALDRLADVLEGHPRAALVGPRVRLPGGRVEASAGWFPTLARERVHAWLLDRLAGWPGRRREFPMATAPVDWVSGCAWLVRAEAFRLAGPLDEGYFMYVEDVDYCRRLWDGGWEVLATPEVEVLHRRGQGSRDTALQPADGGAALVRYFEKFRPDEAAALRRVLARGWRLRRAYHAARARLGYRPAAMLARRYGLALERLSCA